MLASIGVTFSPGNHHYDLHYGMGVLPQALGITLPKVVDSCENLKKPHISSTCIIPRRDLPEEFLASISVDDRNTPCFFRNKWKLQCCYLTVRENLRDHKVLQALLTAIRIKSPSHYNLCLNEFEKPAHTI